MSQQGQTASSNLETQDAVAAETTAVVRRFLEAFNGHDVDAVVAAMTDDCVWESAFPLPDGTRYEGQASVRAYLECVFRSRPDAVSEPEDSFAAGDRCFVRLVLRWTDKDGNPQHFRGIGADRVQDGKVAEHLVYHKAKQIWMKQGGQHDPARARH